MRSKNKTKNEVVKAIIEAYGKKVNFIDFSDLDGIVSEFSK